VYEQEKIALWKEKVDLAKQMQDTNLIPSDFIYDKIFQFSEDQYDEMRDLVIEDKKRTFRMGQVENEGNDPAKTGKSYGTPHDLASLYGAGRMGQNAEVPGGYDEKKPVGRPEEKTSIIGTQKDPLGKDRTGRVDNNTTNEPNIPREDGTPKGGSPLALAEAKRNKGIFEAIPKSFRKEIDFGPDTEPSLLNENNIKGI
jgi:hypothetical protein